MAGGDCGGIHIRHILEVAGGGHGGMKDVVEGHIGGQHTPCDSQGNQDPTVDPFPHRHFPEEIPGLSQDSSKVPFIPLWPSGMSDAGI